MVWDVSSSRWRAQCQVAGVVHVLGKFDDVDAAAEAVCAFRAREMPFAVAARDFDPAPV